MISHNSDFLAEKNYFLLCSEILFNKSTMVMPSCVLGFGKLNVVGAGKKLTVQKVS